MQKRLRETYEIPVKSRSALNECVFEEENLSHSINNIEKKAQQNLQLFEIFFFLSYIQWRKKKTRFQKCFQKSKSPHKTVRETSIRNGEKCLRWKRFCESQTLECLVDEFNYETCLIRMTMARIKVHSEHVRDVDCRSFECSSCCVALMTIDHMSTTLINYRTCEICIRKLFLLSLLYFYCPIDRLIVSIERRRRRETRVLPQKKRKNLIIHPWPLDNLDLIVVSITTTYSPSHTNLVAFIIFPPLLSYFLFLYFSQAKKLKME